MKKKVIKFDHEKLHETPKMGEQFSHFLLGTEHYTFILVEDKSYSNREHLYKKKYNVLEIFSTYLRCKIMKPVVQVKQGKLQGAVQKSVLSGKEYYSFKGIPFAEPPINDLRFQAPVPLEKWDGILDATRDGMPCSQVDVIRDVFNGSEDCLFVNVYTPNLPNENTNLKPVMVFIHGGGFIFGDGSNLRQGPDFLINYEVLMVTTNYRLHAFGFLNMGTKHDVSNCGLRDQILALKWIKENIRQFGGDPENVTIFGESAGAVSVHHLMLSPLAKGLFHKAILQSGTFYSTWNLTLESKRGGCLLARKLGYKGDEDPEAVVEFLKIQPSENITRAANEILLDWNREYPGKSTSFCFLPCIETNTENAVLPGHPETLMKTADPVPLIVGFNDKEGRLVFSTVGHNIFQILQRDFTNCIRHDIKADEKRISYMCKKIKEFYFGDKEVGPETTDAIVDLYSDIFFNNFYESFENITSSKDPVYVYEFSFNGKFNNFSKIRMKNSSISSGAGHADELLYLFFNSELHKADAEFIEPELTVIKNLCTMWSNFAKTGNPTQSMKPEWRPHTTEKPCYLRIDKDLRLVEGNVKPERIEFWKNLLASKASTDVAC